MLILTDRVIGKKQNERLDKKGRCKIVTESSTCIKQLSNFTNIQRTCLNENVEISNKRLTKRLH